MRRSSVFGLRRSLLLVLGGWLVAGSCSDSVQPRSALRPAALQIRASLAGTAATALVVTVSAPDIQPALIFNVEVVNGSAAGTIAVPAGPDRLVVVRAFDRTGTVTHEGSSLVDIRPGNNPALTITLVPLLGDQPINVRIGNFVVRVTPDREHLARDQILALSATVTDLDGQPVSVDAGDIRWASFDTRVATVNTGGVVTGRTLGDVQIVASYAGAAGAALLSVGEQVVAVGDIARCDSTHDEAVAAMVDTLDGLVLTVGDHAYENGRLQDFNNCYHPSWGRFRGRTRPVPGNHEYHTLNAAGYFQYFDSLLIGFGEAARDPLRGYYHFDVGAWRVVALNSELAPDRMLAQAAWLRSLLAATPNRCVLAYWHRARYTSGSHHESDFRVDPLWDTLYVGGADLVVVAHEHNYERFAPQTDRSQPDPQRGMRQFVVGTGGGARYPFRDPPFEVNSEFRVAGEFGVMTLILGTNGYGWRFIAASDGTVRDSGSGVCH